MPKKTAAQVIAASLRNLAHYAATVETTSNLLKLDEVTKNDSLKVTLESAVRMATDNRDREIRKVFSRVAEKVGTNPDAVRTFALSIFPELKDTPVKSSK